MSGRIHPGIYDFLRIYLTGCDILTVSEIGYRIPLLAVRALVAELLLDLGGSGPCSLCKLSAPGYGIKTVLLADLIDEV